MTLVEREFDEGFLGLFGNEDQTFGANLEPALDGGVAVGGVDENLLVG